MKESEIRKRAIKTLQKDNWVCWYPYKSRYKKEQDIFGAYDILIGKNKLLRFIQLTTLSNLSARRKKVQDFLNKSKLEINSEIWAYDKKKKCFKIEIIKKGRS